jgi:hypothetical protein
MPPPKDKTPPEEDYSHITFKSWAPPPFDVQARIRQLRAQLEPGYPLFVPVYQHVNIHTTIKLYEEGKIKGEQVYLQEGQIVTREEAQNGDKPYTVEGGIHLQAANKTT